MIELILTAVFLAVLLRILALVYRLIRQDSDDEMPAPPPDEEQGWTEDEAWDSREVVDD